MCESYAYTARRREADSDGVILELPLKHPSSLNGTQPAFGSIFQIGWAYAIGIAFAIITCGATSGGHFNPAITL
jgi:glycerol uptake facilitator-like aquaporin